MSTASPSATATGRSRELKFPDLQPQERGLALLDKAGNGKTESLPRTLGSSPAQPPRQ